MDLSLPVTYRGFDLNSIDSLEPGAPMNGTRLDDVRMPNVEAFGYREKRSLADGYDYSSVHLGRRVIYLRGTVYGETLGKLHDTVREFRRSFTPTLAYADAPSDHGFLPMDFSVPTDDLDTFPSGIIPMRLYSRPVDQPGFYFARAASGGQDARGYSNIYEAQLEARDPRFYLQTLTEIDVGTGMSGDASTTHVGDYPSPVNVLLTTSGGGITHFTLTGFGTVMTVTIPGDGSTRTVRIDSHLKVCTIEVDGNNPALRMDLVSFSAGYTWPIAQPGSNAYDWSADNSGLDSGSKILYRPAFS